VLVIGGGNTAMDAARTARRLTGRPVTVVYRRSRAEMPAAPEEVQDLLDEGNELVELAAPQRVLVQGGRVVGLVGSSHDLHPPDEEADGYEHVARAVQFARDHLDERLTLSALAAAAGMSGYQFDRRVRRLFRVTTGQMLLKLRIDAAAEQLRDSNRPVAQIALSCGYSDQSAFARQFRRTTGLTPLEYRDAHRPASVRPRPRAGR